MVEQTVAQAEDVVKLIAHGNDVYTAMIFPDEGRWLWFVTIASSGFAEGGQWGRFLGCGDAADKQGAWRRAKRLVEHHKKS